MEAMFLGCLIGGVLFTAVSVIFGDWLSMALDGALDFLSIDGHPILQPTAVVGGITAFGGIGLLLYRYSSLSPALDVVAALVCALLVSVAVFFLYIKPMERSENSTGYSMKEMIGGIAEVLVPIPPSGYGEVTMKVGAGITNQIAASYDGGAIPSGDRVVVVEVKDGALYVARLKLD